jgi:hypothetical protein
VSEECHEVEDAMRVTYHCGCELPVVMQVGEWMFIGYYVLKKLDNEKIKIM